MDSMLIWEKYGIFEHPKSELNLYGDVLHHLCDRIDKQMFYESHMNSVVR